MRTSRYVYKKGSVCTYSIELAVCWGAPRAAYTGGLTQGEHSQQAPQALHQTRVWPNLAVAQAVKIFRIPPRVETLLETSASVKAARASVPPRARGAPAALSILTSLPRPPLRALAGPATARGGCSLLLSVAAPSFTSPVITQYRTPPAAPEPYNPPHK